MAQDLHHVAHTDAHHPIENVCLTGTVVMCAFFGGLAITTLIFAQAFWLHH
jgi:hypothetical protein